MIAEVNEPNSKLLPYLGFADQATSGGCGSGTGSGSGSGSVGATGAAARATESDMVYQFASYPMATHAVLRGTARFFARFVRSTACFRGRQYITVLGSHDGMAMKQAAELLPAEEMEWLRVAQQAQEHCRAGRLATQLPSELRFAARWPTRRLRVLRHALERH